MSAFLTWLATVRQVSASTQNQALSAVLFLYRDVLCQEVGSLPTEVRAVFARLSGVPSRFHLHETVIQRAVAEAARRAGLAKRVSCHTFRHLFAPLDRL